MMKLASRLGIFGGTFSPVHNGHVGAAKAFIESGLIDKLLVIPTLIPPHKQVVQAISASHRYQMLALAFETLCLDGRVEICDYEIRKPSVSYTVETLEHFRPLCDEIKLLCGTDMFLSIDSWHRAEDIFKLCEIVYEKRSLRIEEDRLLADKSIELTKLYDARTQPLYLKQVIDISSSKLRELIAKGKDVSAYIDPKVEKYIKGNHLYE